MLSASMQSMNYQTCVRCRQQKPLERFYFIKRSQKHDTRCKECIREYVNERRQTIPGLVEREHEIQTKSRKKRKQADPTLNTWARKTPEQRQAMYQAVKRWRARNAGQFNKEASQANGLRRSIGYSKAWPVIVHHYGNICLSCGAAGTLCFDHVKPLSQNGPNDLTNGQPLCRKCNTFKGATVQDKDHRPDGGAWIRRLIAANPWLSDATKAGKRGFLLTKEERRAREEWRSAVVVVPQEGVQIAQEESGGSGFQPCVAEDARQIAQKRFIDDLLAHLPR